MQFDQAPDYRVFSDIIQMRQQFLGMQDWGHPRYHQYAYPQRLCLLSDMNRVYILREVGDIKKYIENEKEINAMEGREPSPQDKCILDMAVWTQDVIDKMTPFESEKEKVILTLLVYGEEYTKKCLDIMLKSLMAEGNLPALCKEKQVIFHVQCSADTHLAFTLSPLIQKAKDLGVHFQYAIIPEDLIKQIDISSVYWLIGAAATLGLEYARTCNAAYHHCYPDIIYSNNFFSELLRLTKISPTILAPAHRGDEMVILPAIKSYETEECISVPSADLVAIGLNGVHMCHWPSIVNNRPAMWCYPQTHSLIWETHQFVHFNCPHLNAFWLSENTVAKAPQRFYISLDSELDFLCEGEDYYIPQETDDLYLVEFSNQGKQKVEDLYLDSHSYAIFLWKLITNRDNFKFFVRGMRLKINRDIRPMTETTMEENSLMNEKCTLFNIITSKDPGVGTTLQRPRTHVGRVYGITAKA